MHKITDDVYIFWDHSNIFVPAKEVARRREGLSAERDIRIHFQNVFALARAGRTVPKAICVGSSGTQLQPVLSRLAATGVDLEFYERGGQSRSEQGVDQCLQVHMLRVLADVATPAVAVLLTGDGVGYESGVGFHADLERLSRRGWGVEVISWDDACNQKLKRWAKAVGMYIPREDYYHSVTFRAGLRNALPLSLMHRGRAEPMILPLSA
jgi:hypothetical protein